jgi:hypothetical protein
MLRMVPAVHKTHPIVQALNNLVYFSVRLRPNKKFNHWLDELYQQRERDIESASAPRLVIEKLSDLFESTENSFVRIA